MSAPVDRQHHYSSRGNPLASTTENASALNVPLLTVELCTKWYYLHLIRPDGDVRKVRFSSLDDDFQEEAAAFVDHVPNPEAVRAFAKRHNYHLDGLAEELIEGRWQLEVGAARHLAPEAHYLVNQCVAVLREHTPETGATISSLPKKLEIVLARMARERDQALKELRSSRFTEKAERSAHQERVEQLRRVDDRAIEAIRRDDLMRAKTEEAKEAEEGLIENDEVFIAKAFHQAYEHLAAPSFGYKTRTESRKLWSDMPEPNRSLMLATVGRLLRDGIICRNQRRLALATDRAADERDAAEMGDVLEERDNYYYWAEKLALAIAPVGVLGEHSNLNHPWANALEHLAGERAEHEATTASLRQEIAETVDEKPKDLPWYSGVGVDTDQGHFGIAKRDDGIEVMLDGTLVWSSTCAMGNAPVSDKAKREEWNRCTGRDAVYLGTYMSDGRLASLQVTDVDGDPRDQEVHAPSLLEHVKGLEARADALRAALEGLRYEPKYVRDDIISQAIRHDDEMRGDRG